MFLNCHSYFSLNYGIMSVEELLQAAKENGVTHLALTDINNTSGIIDFMRFAPKYGIHPQVGIDFRKNTEQLFIGIASNLEGYRELNEFLSHYKMRHEDTPNSRIFWSTVAACRRRKAI